MIRSLSLLFLFGLLGACARVPVIPVDSLDLPRQAELVDVPFFAQDEYQCGPAALATVLVQRGVDTSAQALVDSVYIPGRKGSLQVEIVAAARAHGLLVYPVGGRLEAVLAEVAAGNPVLVLQNLGFDQWPLWHFAVVVGYDLERQEVILRSGTTERQVDDFRSFLRSWHKGGRWAAVTQMPDSLPATAELMPWLAAASDLELVGQQPAARLAYERAAERWDSPLPWFALGNSLHSSGDLPGAEQAFRKSVGKDSSFAAAWFNLSHALVESGCATEASMALACSRKLAPDDRRLDGDLPSSVGHLRGQCQALPDCP
ncbi:PA2778 family cysteine peptidase [Pseudomonas sp. ABC1]|nr:PA2778 family cysteine peptidase [Pseudomonas sp. ABC1]QLF95119.1 PA2778 family cysteine peptidase [Pseudomonas sp. ABC1]